MNNAFNKNNTLITLLILNSILCGAIIFIFSNFYTDDYVVFSIISENPGRPISFNQNEIFFLFMRPLSYLSFWIDYHLWGVNPIPMKIFSLVLHLMLITFLYKLLERTSILIWGKVNYFAIFILLLLFSIHFDSMIWIYWISNRTELLHILFYVVAIYNIIKYIEVRKNFYLNGYVVFYILSVLSKQQGLHLPLLVIFFSIVLKNKIGILVANNLLKHSIVPLILMLAFSIFNYYLSTDTLNVEENIWKKPFSLLGIILHSVLPFFSNDIYSFFLFNKILALVILISFILLALLFVFKKKIKVTKSFLIIFTSILIIFYPRILGMGSGRINSIVIFWLIVGLFIIYMNYSAKIKRLNKLAFVIITVFSILNFVAINNQIDNIVRDSQISKESVEEFNLKYGKNLNNLILIGSSYSFFINSYLYFVSHNDFGVNKNMLVPFVQYNIMGGKFITEVAISLMKNKNEFIIESKDKYLKFIINEIQKSKPYIEKIVVKETDIRGYSKITFKIKNDYTNYILVYHDGTKWNEYIIEE